MDQKVREHIDDFLAQKNIAIAGYSSEGNQPSNAIYKKFVNGKYNVFAVNPKHDKIGEVECFKSVKDISQTVDGVVICTTPAETLNVIQDCIDSHISRVWIHRSFGQGSYHQKAIELCLENSIDCIPAGCPMMFLDADIAHKCMKWIINLQGKFEQKKH
jgi:uncharacterized protein